MKKLLPISIIVLVLFQWYACNNNDTSTTTPSEVQSTTAGVKSIFVNGDSLHYIDIGKGEPVVLVHGSWGDYRTWGAQLDTFSKHYRVIAYSRRYAYPNKQVINDSADYSIRAHAKDLAAFLKALNLESIHLVGHSFGAFTALLVTMEHPELVKSLTLGEPPVMALLQEVKGGDTLLNNFFASTLMPSANAFKNNDDEKAAHVFVNGVMGDSTYFSRLSQTNREIIMANSLEARGSLSNKDIFPPVTCADIEKIKTPVLLVYGDKTPMLFSSITGELERCLGNKEKTMLLNTSHGLEYESPDDFNKAVLAFIDKH